MTRSTKERQRNNEAALKLMYELLNDSAIDTALFEANSLPFAGTVIRTTWEDLLSNGYVELALTDESFRVYRLTAKGWLVCLHLTNATSSSVFMARLGRLLATMKKHVKGRTTPKLVSISDIATESCEAAGWIFNVIDSRATTSSTIERIGAKWFNNERGRLIEIPLNFNMEPIDIAAGLNVQHLQKIAELEDRLHEFQIEHARFHCPDCDAPLIGGGQQDFPEDHCIVNYENYECGLITADGFEEAPCRYGPRWPSLDEFEFRTASHGSYWSCYAMAMTDRARRVTVPMAYAATEEQAKLILQTGASPKKKGDRLW